MLEEKSLDCHLEDSEGRTGLMVAAMEGRLGVVKLILRFISSSWPTASCNIDIEAKHKPALCPGDDDYESRIEFPSIW